MKLSEFKEQAEGLIDSLEDLIHKTPQKGNNLNLANTNFNI